MADDARIAFRPHFEVRVLDERRVLLLSEDRSFLLTGKLYVALVPYLDGSRTRAEIVEALRARAPLERIELALSNLLQKKYAAPIPRGVPGSRAAFWTELDLDPDQADRAVRETTVAVQPVGRGRRLNAVTAGQLLAALAEAGFAPADDGAADLTVAIVDDYVQPELDELNRRFRAAGRRWVPFKPGGRVPWLGPIFRPADGPCWACLGKRLVENRPGELIAGGGQPMSRVSRADLPVGRALALNLAALELARVVAGVGDAPLAGPHVLTLDFRSLTVERHLVHRLPVCPVCGDAAAPPTEHPPLSLASRPKLRDADGGSRTATAQEALARLLPHVSPLTGIIAGVVDQSLADGLPIYAARQIYPVAIGPRQNRRIGRPAGAAGKGASDVQAKVSCLAEAVERYSLGWQGTERRRRARLVELGEAAVHPASVMNFSERQYAERETWNKANSGFNWVGQPFQEDRPVDWTPVWSVTGRRVRWLPTQFCYYNYRGEPDHEFYRAESNGCASGNTLEEAILQGFLELVERDSCALWWYNRIRRPAIALDSFDDPFFRRVEAYHRSQDRALYVLDATSDLGIPVAFAVSHGPAGEKIMVGLGAHLDVRVAVSRALAELNQMIVLERGDPAEATDADSQALLRWLAEATTENQPYLVPDGRRRLTAGDYPALGGDDIVDDVEACLAAVRRGGLEMLVLDATRPEIGFPTARVTVPGLRHFWARLGPGRLYDAPVALGWLERALTEAELNPIPFFI